nr:hypothetical protein [Tanacetum cinerariifolium]
VDVALLLTKLRKNRTTHTDYIRHTQEEAATLREIIESERLLSPFNTSLAYALNDTSSTINQSAYMALAPQIKYAPIAYNPSEFSSPEAGLVVPVFQKGDDPIDAINHMMSFLTSVVASRVTIQPIQGRQNNILTGSSRSFASGSGGTSGKQRVVVCYNCRGKGHMSKKCTKPKRKRGAKWFKDKVLLVQA